MACSMAVASAAACAGMSVKVAWKLSSTSSARSRSKTHLRRISLPQQDPTTQRPRHSYVMLVTRASSGSHLGSARSRSAPVVAAWM